MILLSCAAALFDALYASPAVEYRMKEATDVVVMRPDRRWWQAVVVDAAAGDEGSNVDGVRKSLSGLLRVVRVAGVVVWVVSEEQEESQVDREVSHVLCVGRRHAIAFA